MIDLIDVFTLANTKLRTRKTRTIVTVVTASLLFSLLMAAIIVLSGALSSAERLTKTGLSSRYIVSYQSYGTSYEDTPELQARATEIYNTRIVQKKMESKRLGIEFDQTSEIRPIGGSTENGGKYIDASSPSAQQAIAELKEKQETLHQKAKEIAEPYHPIAYYEFLASVNSGVISAMKNGKESFKPEPKQPDQSGMQPGIELGWSYANEKVVGSFLLDKATLATQTNLTDVPVIAPIGKVEEALGLSALPKAASPKEKLNRISYVRKNAAKATFTVCYRNEASTSLIAKTIQDDEQIAKNANNKEYVAPSEQYNLPDETSCGASVLKKDTRTADEKKLAVKQDEFAKKFNEYQKPEQQKVTFRVVGIAQDGMDYDSFSTVNGIVSLIAGSTLQGRWVVPTDMFNQMPNRRDFDKFYPTNHSQRMAIPSTGAVYQPAESQLIEFASAADVKAFYEKNSCNDFSCGAGPMLSYFGSNSVVVNDLKKTALKSLQIMGIIIGCIAALIMMGVIGRVIADGRRETAVFRAIGATRNDMRLVYTMYTALFSLIIVVVSVVIGLGLAVWLDAMYAANISTQMHLAFISAPLDETFRLLGFWPELLLVASGLVILSGLVSMLLPLARNLARNPIKDMRDE